MEFLPTVTEVMTSIRHGLLMLSDVETAEDAKLWLNSIHDAYESRRFEFVSENGFNHLEAMCHQLFDRYCRHMSASDRESVIDHACGLNLY